MKVMKEVDFKEYYLTLFRVLKIVELFKEKEKYPLTKKKIVLFDFYMKYPFMTEKERKKQDFDEEYAFYFWKPSYAVYDAVLSVLLAKKMISCENDIYHIEQNGASALVNMSCEYINELTKAGSYVLKTVSKMSEKKIDEDILSRTKGIWEGSF